jgi:hypothetical protein
MISDSPYEASGLALTPRAGIAAGVTGGLLTFLLITLLQQVSGIDAMGGLPQMAVVFLPMPMDPSRTLLVPSVGAVLYVFATALLGLLYAACQKRIPARGLVIVGLFYGFILWIAGGFIVGPAIGGLLPEALRTWLWLLASLSFGLCLALAAVWATSRPSANAGHAVPLD